MPRTGTAALPLHGGRAPPWLFERMESLAAAVSEVIIEEQGRRELLERLSDPWWFQSLGCLLGYDWHSSGVTTVTCGALKEALDPERHGVGVAGGKGATSRKTPEELRSSPILREPEVMVEASRLSAKVDSSCVQDGHSLYHHVTIYTEEGDWAVVQQGMDESSGYARRYHWLSDRFESYVEEPHRGISAEERRSRMLDLTGDPSEETRQVSLDLVNDGPSHLRRYLDGQTSLAEYGDGRELTMPREHPVQVSALTERTLSNLEEAYERAPSDYEELMATEGVGGRSLRALALVSELVYGTESDWSDPAKYSYAHGGKDGTPFPVDRRTYDETVEVLETALHRANLGRRERIDALERLKEVVGDEA